MKKKLLTVFLAVVMCFGVFGLTACGAGSNPDDSYNYYSSKYGIEEEIKIEAVNYFAVEKMFTNTGNFLIYIDNEDTGAAERFKQMNDLAIEWDVTIYHFNPNLGGGYASNDTMARNIDLTTDLTGDSVVAKSSFAAMQAELIAMLKLKNTTVVPNHYFVAVAGGKTIAIENQNYITKGVNEATLYQATLTDGMKTTGINHAKPELYKLETGYGTFGDNWVGHIFDITKNINGSAKETPYDYEGKSWKDIYNNCYDVTEDGYERNRARYGSMVVANIAYDAQEGYIYHVMNRSYSHSIKKAVDIDTANADPADAIRAIAWKRPSYAKYVDDNGKVTAQGYLTENIDTFNMYGDYRLHMAGDYDTLTSDYTGDKKDVYQLIANYAQFAWLLDHNDGDFAVYFGGPWCPNSQAVMKITDEVAKDYGIEKIYVFDPRLDGGVRVAGYAMAAKRVISDNGSTKTEYDSAEGKEIPTFDFNVLSLGGRPYEHMLSRNADFIQSTTNSGKQSVLGGEMYGANFLYANFLENYLTDYISYWKLSKINIDRNNNGTYEESEKFTEMSVPNLMAFDGSGEGKAVLKAWCEAEYHWAYTSIEGNAKRDAWIEEAKKVFDENSYATYAPALVVEDENSNEESSDSTTTPNGAIESC